MRQGDGIRYLGLNIPFMEKEIALPPMVAQILFPFYCYKSIIIKWLKSNSHIWWVVLRFDLALLIPKLRFLLILGLKSDILWINIPKKQYNLQCKQTMSSNAIHIPFWVEVWQMLFGINGNEKYLLDIGGCTRSWRYRTQRLGFFLFRVYKVVYNIAA